MKLSLLGLAAVVTLALGAFLSTPESALAAAPALAPSPECQTTALPAAREATHTLTLTYQQRSGALRQATLKIGPKSDEVAPLWRGSLQSISVLTKSGRWIIIESFLNSSHSSGHSAEARVMLPAPRDIAAFIVRPQRGPTFGWKVEEGESFVFHNITWDFVNQRGQEIESPRARDGEDDCGPVPAGCEVFNPWTCECDIGLKDPWGKAMEGSSFRVEISG